MATPILLTMQPMLSQYLLYFGQWPQALAYALSKPREIAIVGHPGSVDTQALPSVVRDGYRPFQVVAFAYVCDAPVSERAFACQSPTTEPARLQAELALR